MMELPSWLLTQSAAHAHRLVSDTMSEVGARGYHYRLLSTLAADGPASQAALGRRTGIHLSDMVSSINELAAGGYVVREPDPTDRRRNVITITAAGRRRRTELAKAAATVQDKLLEPLTAGERAELTRLLAKILTHHSARGSSVAG
jgi:DNA-binding MarR family transcriptional regulator